MKRILLTALIAPLLAAAADPYAVDSAKPPRIDGYKLVWHDEFDVDGAPDPASWGSETGFVRNHEAQYYQSGNAVCADGRLVLEARKERIANARYHDPALTGGNQWRADREYADYTSASINTSGKHAFKYGRILVRARIPTAPGAWPAIWTLGVKYDWPSNGEMDIMEFYRSNGGNGDPIILANYCWSSPWGQWTGKWDGSQTKLTHFTGKDPDWTAKYHVWRMDWTEEKVSIYLDDELLNDVLTKDAINEGSWGWHWQGHCPFTQEHYILLNLALGGDNGGPIDDSAMPMRYEVDYVRVYQVGEEPPEENPDEHDPMTLTWSGVDGTFGDRTKWDENYAPASGDSPVFTKAAKSTVTLTDDAATKAPLFSTANGPATTTVDLGGKSWSFTSGDFLVGGANSGSFTFRNGALDFLGARFADGCSGISVTFDGPASRFLAVRDRPYSDGTQSFYHDDHDGYSDKDVSFAGAGRNCTFTLSGGAVFVTGRGFTIGDDWDNSPERSTGNVVRVTGQGTILQTNPHPLKEEPGKRWGSEYGANRLPGAGSDNRLIVQNGATFAVSGKKWGTENANGGGTIIGLTAAHRNRIEINDGGSFRIGGDGGRLIVGYWDACDNGIDITGAGSYASFNLTTVGFCHTTSNNFIRVSDGARADFFGALYIGGTDADRSGKNCEYEYDGRACGNFLSVTGAGTVCTNGSDLFIGYAGVGNGAEVRNGATLRVNGSCMVSRMASSSQNVLLVDNASLSCAGALEVTNASRVAIIGRSALAQFSRVSIGGGSTLEFLADENGLGTIEMTDSANGGFDPAPEGGLGLAAITVDAKRLPAGGRFTILKGRTPSTATAESITGLVRFRHCNGSAFFDAETSTLDVDVNCGFYITIR